MIGLIKELRNLHNFLASINSNSRCALVVLHEQLLRSSRAGGKLSISEQIKYLYAHPGIVL
jgi:hypothetical protein